MLSRQTILSTEVPLVFRKVLDWDILKWSVEQWKSKLGGYNNKYPFREGNSLCSPEPIWETQCEVKLMTMEQFFEEFTKSHESDNSWLYFDYKHISEWFSDTLKDISWKCMGFPERGGKDSTLWIGTEGAHTPCHMDSYGCNLVAQLYGKKLWLLFDPSETCNLLPTRVPYEESSVYSSINFSCTCHQFPDIEKARFVILEPGDVLYVPNHWWHYVENITAAISINTWIPVDSDDESRIEESLVKCFISSIVQKLEITESNKILNPNERDLKDIESKQNMNELNWCLQKLNTETSKKTEIVFVEPLLDFTIPVHKLDYIIKNIKGKCKIPSEIQISDDSNKISFKHVINAFCHPDVIMNVRKILCKEFK